jgi:hypothetical protein
VHVRGQSSNHDLSKFGYMHEFRIISTIYMTYTKLQNYTIMMVGEHEMQTFKIVVVVLMLLLLLFDV